MRHCGRRGGAAGPMLFAAAALAASLAQAADRLPAHTVEPDRISVSGLSSGAYMAGQFHVAFSEEVIGAGIVAGGPYGCAEGSLAIALNRCMETGLGPPDPARLLDAAKRVAERDRIDPLEGLAGDRVLVFSGTADETVTPPVVAQVAEFYRLAGLAEEAILFVDDVPAGHGMVTEDRGNSCGSTGSPFLNDCDFDLAGRILAHIHGPLDPPAAAPDGRVIEFAQAEFLHDPTAHGMAETGFAYVPADCAEGAACGVHVAFHGCRQNADRVGDAFVAGAGYNRWAEANRLIVLYPQAHETPGNPNGCWDWWGYDDPDHATRSGRQMAAVRAMLSRLAGDGDEDAFCEVHDGFNFAHWQEGRARLCGWWSLCAVGSGDRLGLALNRVTLYERPAGLFGTAPCEAD